METPQKFASVDEVLDFCIQQEEASARLYSALADLMERPDMAELFRDLSELERKHGKKLREVKAAKLQLCLRSNVPEIEIRNDLPLLHEGPHMGCREAIGLAIKKEVISATVYAKLAEIVEDEAVRSMLLAIADEETKHKRHFDTEYEKCVLTEV